MSVIGKLGYQETAAGWIPSDWRLCPLRDTGEILSGSTPATTVAEYWNGGIPWCTPTDITRLGGRRILKSTEKSISAKGLKNSGAVMIKSRSVLVCTRATVGVCAINEEPVTTNQGFKSIVTNENFLPDYLYYVITNLQPELKKKAGGSTFLEINKTEFEKILVCQPGLLEQQKIAAILTVVDDKLDVISRQIIATKILKQSLMQTLFSRGVGTQDADGRWMPHTEFKDSELGDIPVGWTADKLDSHVTKVGSGITPKGGSESYLASGIPLIRSQNVLVGKLSLDDVVFISEEQHQKMRNSALEPKDVLLNITGASIGRCAILSAKFEIGNVNQHVCIIRTLLSLDPYYLCHYLNSDEGQKQVGKFQAGGNREGLNFQQIRSFDIPLPNLREQQKIAMVLDGVDAKLDALATKQAHHQTLKRGLMQKLLTGEWRVKLDDIALAD